MFNPLKAIRLLSFSQLKRAISSQNEREVMSLRNLLPEGFKVVGRYDEKMDLYVIACGLNGCGENARPYTRDEAVSIAARVLRENVSLGDNFYLSTNATVGVHVSAWEDQHGTHVLGEERVFFAVRVNSARFMVDPRKFNRLLGKFAEALMVGLDQKQVHLLDEDGRVLIIEQNVEVCKV